MLMSIGSRPFGIFEHKGHVEPDLFHQAKGLQMIFLSFGTETAKEIGRQGTFGEDAPDRLDPVEIPFPVILAVHQFQDPGASRLYRQMNMFADIRIGSHGFQNGLAHVFRMGSGKADPHIRKCFSRHLQQIAETNRFYAINGIPVV